MLTVVMMQHLTVGAAPRQQAKSVVIRRFSELRSQAILQFLLLRGNSQY